MLKFVKVFEIEVPVWVDGVRTDDKETRLKAMFMENKSFNGLQVRGKVGSMFIQKEWTEKKFLEHWSTEKDYSKVLGMEPIEGSDFYKVVVL